MAVNVTFGDVFTSDCDVLINTTGPDYNLDSKLRPGPTRGGFREYIVPGPGSGGARAKGARKS